jgi:citrate lyase subunit beta/citryl-CoA lyase
MPRPFEQLTIARDFPVRRSELTCPAHSEKMMAKAAASQADEVILDLEDACAVSQKVAARKTLIAALGSLDFGTKIRAYRVNGVRTPYCYRDLVEVLEAAGKNVDVVVVPKVDGPEDLHFVDRLISQIEENVGLPPGRIRLEALIESAQGLLHAEAIARASPRMASLIFGIADYAGDVGAKLGADPFVAFHYPKAHLIAAARAAGLAAIDHVTMKFKDLELTRREAEGAAALGFDGKWAVHPGQVEPLNRAFTPTDEELDRALAIVRAYADADTTQGVGAIVVQDEMVDAASLRVEWKRLAVARKAGLLDEQFRRR